MCSRVCIVLFLVLVSTVIAQYHVHEYGRGYDSPRPPRKPLTRPTFMGGKGVITHGKVGKRKVQAIVNYVTPPSTSYGKPVKELYKPAATSYFEKPGNDNLENLDLGGHDAFDYGLGTYASNYGSFGNAEEYAGRVRVQVYRGPTTTYGYKEYAPWGYYVIQPSDDKRSFGHFNV